MYTYLIYDGSYYKIGKSVDPEKRVSNIRTANPKAILLGYGEGDEEDYLHNKYESFRYSREWFKLDEKQEKEILDFLKTKRTVFTDLLIVITFGKYKGLQVCELVHDSQINYMKWFLKNSNKNDFWHKIFLKQIKRLEELKKKFKNCKKNSTYKQKINKRKF